MITVYRNQPDPKNRIIIYISKHSTFENVLEKVSKDLGMRVKILYNTNKRKINSIESIAENSVLFASSGESFMVENVESFSTKPSLGINIAIMGAAAVGKSAITKRYKHDEFVEDYDPTISEIVKKTVLYRDENCVVSILDTAGMEDYQSLEES